MMKTNLFILFFCLFLGRSAHAQLESKGWWTRDLFTFQYYKVPGKTDRDLDRVYKRLFTQPEVGYALNKHWMVGLVTQYEFSSDRYVVPADTVAYVGNSKRFYGAGPLLRYYFPLGKRVCLMPEFYLFYSHEIHTEMTSNVGNSENRYTVNTFGAGTFPSLVCFLTRDLALSLTVASVNYYKSKQGTSFTVNINPQQWLLGVEYYFERRTNVPPPTPNF